MACGKKGRKGPNSLNHIDPIGLGELAKATNTPTFSIQNQ